MVLLGSSLVVAPVVQAESQFGLLSKQIIEKVFPFVIFDKFGPTLVLSPQRRGVFPEEVKGTPMAYPGFVIDHYDSLKTRQQYMRTYNPIRCRFARGSCSARGAKAADLGRSEFAVSIELLLATSSKLLFPGNTLLCSPVCCITRFYLPCFGPDCS